MTRSARAALALLVAACSAEPQRAAPVTTCPAPDDAGATALVACGGACVDTWTDPTSCGACGVACRGAPRAPARCVSGQCVVACEPGYADGNGDLGAPGGDGCEAPEDEAGDEPNGWALSFDRSFGDHLRVPRADDLEPTGPFTVEAWVRPRDLPDSADEDRVRTLLCKALHGDPDLYAPWSSPPHAYSYALFFQSDGIQARTVPDPKARHWGWSWPTDGAWHHLAFVYAGKSGELFRWCFDGECTQPVDAPAASPRYEPVDLYVGIDGLDGVLSRPFDGWLDDVRIWSVTRSQAEVLADMRAAITGPVAGLVASWSFDEGQGAVAHDASGHDHHGIFGSVSGTGPRWVRSDRR